MMNSANGMMTPSSSSTTTTSGATNTQSSATSLKNYFKSPEGRYKLQYEKSHPSGLLHYSHGKTVSQVTVAHLKDKPTLGIQASTSGAGVASGVRSAAARILGAGNGRALSFVGGNGGSKYAGTTRNGSIGSSSLNSSNNNLNFDGKGTYLIFNVGDTIFISDLNSQDKDPIKSLHFSNSNPLCHAFDPDAKDGHDLLIGLSSGDIYSVSLRQQLQDMGKKLVGAHHYNKDGTVNSSIPGEEYIVELEVNCKVSRMYFGSRCTSIAWVPKVEGTFVVAHSDGNMYVYEKSKDGAGDTSFPVTKDQAQFSVAHARTSKSRLLLCLTALTDWEVMKKKKMEAVDEDGNGVEDCQPPAKKRERVGAIQVRLTLVYSVFIDELMLSFSVTICLNEKCDQTILLVLYASFKQSNPTARWHICQGSINSIAFSNDGVYMATVGRDGYLRVFDYLKEQLMCGGKSYYGALLCCAWSGDGKYILTGGEDDLVQVWSMEDRKVVAWGEGHTSWVSGVAFDPYWAPPNSDDSGENSVYRFGSVGQDTQLLLWDLEMSEIVVPLRRAPGGSPRIGSPTYSTASQSPLWDSACAAGPLQPSPSMRDVPKLSPVVIHRVHTEPLSGVIFTQESVLTACREGHIKVWMRPGCADNQSGNSDSILNVGLREKPVMMAKSGYKQ
ncbi:putative catabolite repression protein creC [Bienertia sinuspersici]